MARRDPRHDKPPRALRAGNCTAEARRISTATGLGIVEVENLLRAGRTAADLLTLADPARKP